MNKLKMLHGDQVSYVDLKEFFRVRRYSSKEILDFDILDKIRKKYFFLIEEYGYPFNNYMYIHLSQFDEFVKDFIDAEHPKVFIQDGKKTKPHKLFNFYPVVKDENVIWNDDRIRKYAPISNKICSNFWDNLLEREDVSIDRKLFSEIKEWISFDALSSFKYFEWDITFIREHAEKLNFKKLSGNPHLPWKKEFIVEYYDKWVWGLKYKSRLWRKNQYERNDTDARDCYNINPCISNNPAIFWTLDLFEEFEENIDVWVFVANAQFDPEIILKRADLFLKTETISHRYRTGEGTEWTDYEVPRVVRYIFNPYFSVNRELISWAQSIKLSDIFTQDFKPYYTKSLWDYWQENIVKSLNC